jgi:hypothetical protein
MSLEPPSEGDKVNNGAIGLRVLPDAERMDVDDDG